MMIEITMSTRNKLAFADGVYCEGKTVVKSGGRISAAFHGNEKIAAIRQNSQYVNENGTILKDCEFATPSEAAQFVNGNISNGYRVWKVKGVNLGDYLKSQGLK